MEKHINTNVSTSHPNLHDATDNNNLENADSIIIDAVCNVFTNSTSDDGFTTLENIKLLDNALGIEGTLIEEFEVNADGILVHVGFQAGEQENDFLIDNRQTCDNTLEELVPDGSNNLETIEDSSKKRRMKNPVSLKERKRLKMEATQISHTVRPPCNENCKKKCLMKINEERRGKLNSMYWKMTSDERRSFILSTCKRSDPKRRTTGYNCAKKSTFTYQLSNEKGSQEEICKVFFLTTLGYNQKNDKILTTVLTKTPRQSIKPNPDLRGKAPSKMKGPSAEISEHIERYNPAISHYRREHAPNRKYLPSDITISSMHKQFLETFPQFKNNVSYEQYRKVVKSKNISFAKLGHEECEECEEFKLHPHTKDDIDPNCNVCKEWEVHKQKAEQSREAYKKFSQNELPEGTICFSCDLQKIVMLPRVDGFKSVIFLKRLIAYNETYAPVGKKSNLKPLLCVWHGAISNRNKEELVSSMYKFLKENRDCNIIHLWMDNCSSQNKNWCLYTFLINIINSDNIATQELNLWYFEPGHSFMSADSVHHQVELAMKHQGKVYDFNDFVNACKAKGKHEVFEMNPQDFFMWKDGASKDKLKVEGRVKLREIVHVKAKRGSYILEYKTTYNPEEEYKKLDFLQKKLMKKKASIIPQCLDKPCGFDITKRDKLLKTLDGILPENRKLFWTNLPPAENKK